jgi:lincosamide nucleotidyltransferase A/C/D/E
MLAETVVMLYTLLQKHGVQIWIDGGWGIDALLQQQTRPHKDLDALVQFDDLATMADLLAERGFTVKQIWPENHWVSHESHLRLVGRETPRGNEVATAFVLRNDTGHELDFHVLKFNERGYGIAAWNSNLTFPPDALEGRGVIVDTPVRCLSAQMQMTTHTGYALQAKDLQDLRYLHECFGIAYLEEQAHRIHQGTDDK